MATYKKLLKDKNGDTIIPVTNPAETADIADSAVTSDKIDFTTVGTWKCLGSVKNTNSNAVQITFDHDYDMYDIFIDFQTESDSWADLRALDENGNAITGSTTKRFYIELSKNNGVTTNGVQSGSPIAVAPALAYQECTGRITSTNSNRGSFRSFGFQCGCTEASFIGTGNLGRSTNIYGFLLRLGVTAQNLSLTVFGRDLTS